VAKLNLVVPIYPERIFAGFEVLGMTERTTLWGDEVDGFAVVNLTLFSQRLIKNLEFSASVYNLLNTRYADPAGMDDRPHSIPQDGRNFRVKLTYRF
jgi:iron complex outermembrane receptor protein